MGKGGAMIARQGQRGFGGRVIVPASGLLVGVWLALGIAVAAESAEGPKTAPTIEKGAQAPHRVTSPHFVTEFSVPPPVGRTYGVLCERAYANFRRMFNVEADEVVWEGKCQVYLFATRDEMVKFATTVTKSLAAAQSAGYTNITTEDPTIVLYLDKNDQGKLRRTLVHEMTHVFLQLFHGGGAKVPVWLHEGFAQYFEFDSDPEHSRRKDSKARIKRLVAHGQQAPLERFWTMDFPPTDMDSYAQAWSLVDFMVQRGSAKMTGQFILQIKEGVAQEEALRNTFRCSLPQFEAAWRRYAQQSY